MKKALRPLFIGLLCLTAFSGAAQAACYADYKAKKNAPLRLHYGVIELPDAACGSKDAASREISARIGRDGWILLNVMSTFGQDGLATRKDSAGDFYLRY